MSDPREPTVADVLARLDDMGQRFDRLETKVDRLETKVDRLETNVTKLAELCTAQFENIHARLDGQPPRGSEGWEPSVLS